MAVGRKTTDLTSVPNDQVHGGLILPCVNLLKVQLVDQDMRLSLDQIVAFVGAIAGVNLAPDFVTKTDDTTIDAPDAGFFKVVTYDLMADAILSNFPLASGSGKRYRVKNKSLNYTITIPSVDGEDYEMGYAPEGILLFDNDVNDWRII